MDFLNSLFNLDKDIPVPLYYQLKQQILVAINNNVLHVGDTFPPEVDICDRLGISRPTVRQALSELVAEGYLSRMKGKGTFISKPKIDARFFKKLESFNNEMIQKGLKPTTTVLELKVINGSSLPNNNLNIPVTDQLVYLKRLRYSDNDPIVLLETFLPYQKFPKLINENFEYESLYSSLEKLYSTRVEKVSREIEAINASASDAKALQISKNKAICLVKTIAYSDTGMPVEYSIARYRGDRNKFSIDLYR